MWLCFKLRTKKEAKSFYEIFKKLEKIEIRPWRPRVTLIFSNSYARHYKKPLAKLLGVKKKWKI